MANRKLTRPTVMEWVVGMTIDNALGPIPKNKRPKKREVIRVEVTTDDESEEDTVKITYPRTGRTTPPPPVTETKTKRKNVRFEDGTGPLKSAMKQTTTITTPLEFSDEESDSASEAEAEIDSSQSEVSSTSDATDSDRECTESCAIHKKKKKRKQKQKQTEDDSESDWDPDPDPTCKKLSEANIPPSPETSESEAEEAPKHKQKSGKKKGEKKAKQPETEPDTSESEVETPAPKKQKQSNKQQPKNKGKQKAKKKQEPAQESDSSEDEPEPPMSKKQQKANNKKAKQQRKQEPEEDEGESSESAEETDEGDESEAGPKQQNKGKQKNNKKKKNGKQPNKKKQKANQETDKEPEAAGEEDAPEASKEQEQGKSRKMKGKEKAQPRRKGPHIRRQHLIEPIRTQVVQTECVIKTPEDPAPNAYYDAEHNVMRVYHGPAYSNPQGQAVYPEHSAFNRPLPMGQPHPLQPPFYYGFNNPQQYPNYAQMPSYHQNFAGMPPPEAYSNAPITQGMPPHPWYAMAGASGPPPSGYYGKRSPNNRNTSTSDKGKDKASQNNVGPPGSRTGQENPYLPKRNRSQFSAWGSQRNVSKGSNQPPGSDKAGSNEWNNNNDNNDQGNTWNDGVDDNKDQNGESAWGAMGQDNNKSGDAWNTNNNQAVDDWNTQAQDTSLDKPWVPIRSTERPPHLPPGKWGSSSNKSNETVKKAGDHWGNDTFPGASSSWDDQAKDASSLGQGGADNNVGAWGTDGDGNGNEQPPSSQEATVPDSVMPGTWVDTPGVAAVPSWGDPTAAADTNGQVVHW
ncbi:hypothetical protein F53441_4160 [Fusarium austroafricanum]|uniref:Uncharacterized protein n=1 Tax=Fusarium austroafricanum TaxID=2364996 RepID=A0A8H4KKS7_9HYPO|nr:hypothetical protein F53441_4160 [Fusarium austroafricanum]